MHTLAPLVALALSALPPGDDAPAAPPPAPGLTLESLADLGTFPLTLDGTPQADHPAEKPCLYFEWGWGEKERGRFVEHTRGQQSDKPLLAHTPKGDLELPVHALRTFLAPVYSQTFKPKDVKRAPPMLRRQLEEKKTVTLEDYCLVTGQRYWARVRMDKVTLPPEEGSTAPVVRHHAVLLVSDQPFKGDQPVPPLTPGYVGWTY